MKRSSPPPAGAASRRIGPYAVVGTLGQGAMGVVFEGRHLESGDAVAIKTVSAVHERHVVGIRREVHALRQLQHPGIVRIVGDGVESGRPWYAMELLRVPTLAELRRDEHLGSSEHTSGGHPPAFTESDSGSFFGGETELDLGPYAVGHRPLRPSRDDVARGYVAPGLHELLRVVRSLCQPLGYAHRFGVVHRDLKPANIFVKPSHHAMLVDFGLASRFGSQGRETLDITGDVRGTPAYIAPEQLRGELVDARADFYSLGCILYQLVTGAPPFRGKDAREVVRKQLDEAPAPLIDGGWVISTGLEDLIMRLLRKERRHRIGHAEDLDAALEALGVTSPDSSATRPTDRSDEAGPLTVGPVAPNTLPPHLFRPSPVGRESAETTLRSAIADARAARGNHVTLTGESGVGKTFLASFATGLGLVNGMTVVTADCAVSGDRELTSPLFAFQPVLQLILGRALAGGLSITRELLGARATVLAAHEPAFRDVPGFASLPALPELPPESARDRLVEAVAATVLALTRSAPLLLVLDDLQWADELTTAVLALLTKQRLAGHQLLILSTLRADQVPDSTAEMLKDAGVQRIELGRLCEASVGKMVADMLAMDSAPPTIVTSLFRHSAGNPFYVAAYLQEAVASRLIVRDHGAWRVSRTEGLELRAPDGWDRLDLPSRLRALLDGRIGALSGPTRAIVDAAAILGRAFDETWLRDIADISEVEAFAGVSDAVSRLILEPSPSGGLHFAHDILRDAAVRTLSDDRRRILHRRAGDTLAAAASAERRDVALSLRVVQHYREAGETGRRFIDALTRAGRFAFRSSAYRSAIELLEEASRLIESDPTTSLKERATIERLIGEAMLGVSDHEGARRHLMQCVSLYGEPIPDENRALALRLLREVTVQAGRRLWPRLARTGTPRETEFVRALGMLQVAVRPTGDALRILYTTVRALNLAEDSNAPGAMAHGFALAQVITGTIPWHSAALRYRTLAHEAMERAPEDPIGRSWVLHMDSVFDFTVGRFREAVATAKTVLGIAREHGVLQRAHESNTLVSFGQACLGELADSTQSYTALMDDACGHSARYENWALGGLVTLALRRGAVADAAAYRDRSRALATSLCEPVDRISVVGLEAIVAHAEGDFERALTAATDGIALLATLPPVMLETTFSALQLGEVLVGLALRAKHRPSSLKRLFQRKRTTPDPAVQAEKSLGLLRAMSRAQPFLAPEHAYLAGRLAGPSGRVHLTAALSLARARHMRLLELRCLLALRALGGSDPAAADLNAMTTALGLERGPWDCLQQE
ncbi:MAG: protein kinase [Myxococcales bacterium]|nr:protein kinase [Myxococcales bacterium]